MREIKFRAWDGSKMYRQHNLNIFQTQGSHPFMSMTKFVNGKREIVVRDGFKKDAVMQYTGLKDKNGKEIYEGDIVKENTEIFVVKFIINLWNSCFQLNHISKGWHYGGDGKGLEIIGNKFENPELLEVTK